jgi:hypothetical protein
MFSNDQNIQDQMGEESPDNHYQDKNIDQISEDESKPSDNLES